MLATIRTWSDAPIHTVIYTHGHIDHTGGMATIDAEADAAGRPRPRIVGHRAVARRLRRYIATQGFNSVVQGQQFGYPDYTYPVGQRVPDLEYDETLSLDIGGTRLDLAHGRGETDDATFVWLPAQRVLASGDFMIWMFPNAGNPGKVQRYAAEWAATLRRMQALGAETIIPGHGPVIDGRARVDEALDSTAAALEHLVAETLRRMNQGASLETVLTEVAARPDDLAKPWLRAAYDDPGFVVRGIWHLNAGWFDNKIASLRPPSSADLARELANLAGGPARIMDRASEIACRRRPPPRRRAGRPRRQRRPRRRHAARRPRRRAPESPPRPNPA
jgi:glyoxylase-like metal-dependent hydrolase (beta-lactamase superfamily II)